MIPRISCAKSLIALTAIVVAAQAYPAYAQNARALYNDLRQIHMIDNRSAILDTTHGDYKVTFRTPCQVDERGEYFVLNRARLGQYVAPGDVFDTSGTATPCTIESVTPLRDLVQTEGD